MYIGKQESAAPRQLHPEKEKRSMHAMTMEQQQHHQPYDNQGKMMNGGVYDDDKYSKTATTDYRRMSSSSSQASTYSAPYGAGAGVYNGGHSQHQQQSQQQPYGGSTVVQPAAMYRARSDGNSTSGNSYQPGSSGRGAFSRYSSSSSGGLPTQCSPSSSAATNNPYRSKKSSGSATLLRVIIVAVCLVSIATVGFLFKSTTQKHQKTSASKKYLEDQVRRLTSQQRTLQTQNDQLKRQVQKATAEGQSTRNTVKSLQSERNSLSQSVERLQKQLVAEKAKKPPPPPAKPVNTEPVKEWKEKVDKLEKREEEVWKRLDSLTEAVQNDSRNEVLERFGPGPHRVKMHLQFPKETDAYISKNRKTPFGGLTSFTIELAPLDLMPHAVHVFLEQVKHLHWDGRYFVLNAKHVLQASATAGMPMQNPNQEVEDQAPYQTVSFQEYHEEFPHEEWTLGFAGRPAGRDFYINTKDNTKVHGPGGQSHHDLHEEADPCFGKIVDGLNAIIDVTRLKTGEDNMLVRRVQIVKAEILKPEDWQGKGQSANPAMGKAQAQPAKGQAQAQAQKSPNPPKNQGQAQAQKSPNPPKNQGQAQAQKSPNPPKNQGQAQAQKTPNPPKNQGQAQAQKSPNPPKNQGQAQAKGPNPPKGQAQAQANAARK